MSIAIVDPTEGDPILAAKVAASRIVIEGRAAIKAEVDAKLEEAEATVERLRVENVELKQQLEGLKFAYDRLLASGPKLAFDECLRLDDPKVQAKLAEGYRAAIRAEVDSAVDEAKADLYKTIDRLDRELRQYRAAGKASGS